MYLFAQQYCFMHLVCVFVCAEIKEKSIYVKSWKTTDLLDHFSLEKSILKLFLAWLTICVSLWLQLHILPV